MKKIFLLITIIVLLAPKHIFAQTDSVSASPTPTIASDDSDSSDATDNKIDQIKDRVTSKVAKLKLVEKRGVVGTVDSVSGNEIRVNDLNDKTRIIDVDELTKYSSEDNSTFDLSDIKKGSKISAIGLYNKDSERLLARFVNEISIPLFLNGVISDKNSEDFTIELTADDGKNYTVDVESLTKSFSYSDGDLNTSGFSKIKPMQNVIVIGYPDPKKENRITASRVIIFPDVPKNPRIDVEIKEPSGTKSPTPTTEK